MATKTASKATASTSTKTAAASRQLTVESALRAVTAMKGAEKRAAYKDACAQLGDADAKKFRAAYRAAYKAHRADAAPKELLTRIAKADRLLTKASEMVEMIGKDDEGLGAAESLAMAREELRAASKRFTALFADGWTLPKPTKRETATKRTIEVGTVMVVKPKAREQFDGILTDAEMDHLVVAKVVKGIIFCTTDGGDKVMISRTKLNYAPTA